MAHSEVVCQMCLRRVSSMCVCVGSGVLHCCNGPFASVYPRIQPLDDD